MENNNNKIITYCLIALVIVATLIAIIGIQMIDFSSKEENLDNTNTITNTTTNPPKKIVKEVKNEVEENNTSITTINQNSLFVTEDRITMYLEEGNGKLYFQFDSNNILEGMYIEVNCDSEKIAETMETSFKSLSSEINVKKDGKNLIVEYPMEEELKGLNKEQVENKLKEGYQINYR